MNIIKRILIFALSSCIILSLFLSDTGRRTRFLTTLAGPGMLSLVSQSLNIPPQNTALLLKNPATPSSTSKIKDITTISAKESPRIALTFDDGPNATYTPLLLDGLRERNIHASFFLVGENIEGNEGILQQMQKDGHLIGNHTWDHVQLDKISVPKARLEIEKQTTASTKSLAPTPPTSVHPSVHGSKTWNSPSPCSPSSGTWTPWTGKAKASPASSPLQKKKSTTAPSS